LKSNPCYRKIRSSTTSTISNATTTIPSTFTKRCSSNSIANESHHPNHRHFSNHHHHHHYNHHFHHHNHSQQTKINTNLNETIRINQNNFADTPPSSSSPKSDKRLHSLLKFYKKLNKKLNKPKLLLDEFDSIMNEIDRILNDSNFQFKQASASLDSYNEKFGSYEVRDQSGTLLNSSYVSFFFPQNSLKKKGSS